MARASRLHRHARPEAPMSARRYDGVALCCPVTEPYVRRSEQGAAWWLARALRRLCAAGGIAKAQIDGLCVSSFTLHPDTAVGFTQYAGLSPRMLEWLPMGGACGIVALRRAARAVQCGDADIVACIAGDTANDSSFRDLLAQFSSFSRDAVYPYGAGGPNASFALIADAYMRSTGATRADFGRVAVSQRANAQGNLLALLRAPMTLQDYLDARVIAEPLHLLDCVMPCAGADGFLVMAEERARTLNLPYLRVLGAIERHNAFPDDPVQLRGGWVMDRDALWAQTGIGPRDMQLIETYDDYPIISLLQFEGLGLCAAGEGPDFVRRRDFTIRGDLPHNTGGGQLSMGQAGAAGGYLGLVEAMRQLLGQAEGRQVADARHALVSGFGMINYDRGLCSAATVLARA
jgi:acetyl-CoA acetyltransferase